MKSLGKKFPNVQFFMGGYLNTLGTVEFFESNFTLALYFVENDEKGENPFLNDKFVLTPLTNPMKSIGKHHIFDLNYYAEITIIESPARLCFHDPSQEPGISLNFRTKEEFYELFNYLSSKISITTPGLPGFFQITRLHPQLSLNMAEFNKQVNSLKETYINDKTDESNLLLEAQNEILPKIAPQGKTKECSKEAIDKALGSENIQDLKNLILEFSIPNDKKADAWCRLCDIGDISNPDKVVLDAYKRVKEQYMSLTESQYRRSMKKRTEISNLSRVIDENIQKLFTVVADESVAQIAFNVLMAIDQTYDFMFQHTEELISILRVLLWLFVRSVKGSELYEVREGVEYDQSTLESVLYWSMLFLIEKFEIKISMLEKESMKKKKKSDVLGDLCFLLHPRIYQLLYSKGVRTFSKLTPLFTLQFSTLLTLCDCVDIWLFGVSTTDPILFMQCMVLSGIFFFFPSISEMPRSQEPNLTSTVEQIFKTLGHTYLQNSGAILMGKMKEIILENFPQLSDLLL